MRRQGQKYSFTGIPESSVTSQTPSITELLLAGAGQGFEIPLFVPGYPNARSLHLAGQGGCIPPVALGSCPYLLTLLFPATSALGTNTSFRPAELLLCPKCCQFKGLWLSSSGGQSFLGQMPYGLWNLGL